jgi:hypothetical protein
MSAELWNYTEDGQPVPFSAWMIVLEAYSCLPSSSECLSLVQAVTTNIHVNTVSGQLEGEGRGEI